MLACLSAEALGEISKLSEKRSADASNVYDCHEEAFGAGHSVWNTYLRIQRISLCYYPVRCRAANLLYRRSRHDDSKVYFNVRTASILTASQDFVWHPLRLRILRRLKEIQADFQVSKYLFGRTEGP